jgi:hypothetical protein
LQPKQNCNMNKYFDLNRSTSTVRPQPFDLNRSTSTVRPQPFDLNRSTSTVRPQPFTGISTKIAWADGFLRAFCLKMAKKPPDTEGSPFQ